MNLQEINGVKIYNLTTYQNLPEWTSRAEKRKQLKRNPTLRNSFQLIQDLEMPDASTFITTSPDQQYLFLMGRYKPRIRCYDLTNLSMKFERCLDHQATRMTCLSEDYSKFALVQDDRWVEVHSKGGYQFKFRIPRCGSDITFCPWSSDLLIAGNGNEIYRMNLSEGCFQRPLQGPFHSSSKNGFTACQYNSIYNIVMATSNIGRVDGFDTRCEERVCGIDVSQYAPRPEEFEGVVGRPGLISCTSLMIRQDGLNIAVGTNEGLVHVYDIRQNKAPYHTRDVGFRYPIKSVKFHKHDHIVAMSRTCVKIWNIEDGKLFVGFDTGFPELNWMHHINDTGLIFLANESPKVMSYFIPLLGEAPMWAHHLDNLIYELSPESSSMYDGYRFITRQQLLEYGMIDLIGTNFLRAYMHGYFVSTRLLNRILKKIGLLNQGAGEEKAKGAKPKTAQSAVEASANYESLTVEEKLDSIAVDDRFAKLQSRKIKFKYDQTDEDVDLMRVHEARLKKKRRRKELRKERATYAKKLISDSSQKEPNSDDEEDSEEESQEEEEDD